jgi:hypothetical protein
VEKHKSSSFNYRRFFSLSVLKSHYYTLVQRLPFDWREKRFRRKLPPTTASTRQHVTVGALPSGQVRLAVFTNSYKLQALEYAKMQQLFPFDIHNRFLSIFIPMTCLLKL